MKNIKINTLASLIILPFSSAFAGVISGQVYDNASPTGLTEHCIVLDHAPGGDYKKDDTEKEQRFCTTDLYSEDFGFCPKINSTSAGVIIYKLQGTGISRHEFETTKCNNLAALKKFKVFAKFKTTMNQHDTSGTFSKSGLLYYHLSRYFNSTIDVPTGVYKTFDKATVCRMASIAKGKSPQSRAAWQVLKNACVNPASYIPTSDIFTPDQKQFYGILYKGYGDRYGAEINSARKTTWGTAQSVEIQTTASFAALDSSKDLLAAMALGETSARKNSIMNTALGSPLSKVQMAYWMKEMSEMAVLDYIFSQQDRVGNIDFNWIWVYPSPTEQGKVETSKADIEVRDNDTTPRLHTGGIKPPAEIAQYNPILIQKTAIKDNDAGGRVYVNRSKITNMVANLRHFNADTYAKLQGLAEDFQSKGTMYQYFLGTFDLTPKQFSQLTSNTIEVANILKTNCKAGLIKFDLKPKKVLLEGNATADQVDCEKPNQK